MLITALTITDYKRVRKVAITPDADRHLILVAGKNRQGKSSTIDALSAAFGGAAAVAADPVRHGADEAEIDVQLADGAGGPLSIRRTITPDGKTQLEVRDLEGAVRRPQELLNKLVGARFLDPLRFLRLAPAEQRTQLMKLIPEAARIADLDAKRMRAFDRRTEVGRERDRAEGELARLPDVPVGELVDVAALTAEQRAFGEQQRAGEALGAAVERAERVAVEANDKLGSALARIEDMKRALAELEARVPEIERALAGRRAAADKARVDLDAAGAAWQAALPRREQIEAELASANERNAAVFKARAQNERRAETAAQVAALNSEHAKCTEAIDTIDTRKAELLAASPLPVDGLAIGEDGILLAGVPFAQASQSEQWRVALGLAIAGSPGLGDVWIKDGAVLDDEALELVAALAEKAGKRVWVERVGTKDAGAIVIQDGEVAR